MTDKKSEELLKAEINADKNNKIKLMKLLEEFISLYGDMPASKFEEWLSK